MQHVEADVRAAAVARLREKRAEGRSISPDVRRAAAGLAVTERTVWRWISDGTTGRSTRPTGARPSGYVLTEVDRDEFLDWNGNVAALWRARIAKGESTPSLRTLQRAFAAQLAPGERAAAVDGVAGRRRHEVYLRWEAAGRNARWEADHKELPVLVTPPRGTRPVKPWATVFIDCFSRLLMGWAVSLRPDSGTVLAALRAAVVVDPARGPFGGVPYVLVPDNGLEFAATALERACAALGVELDPTDAYAPHQKGKVERVNRTTVQELLSGLPFHTGGPRAADGRLYGPDAAPMTLALFVDRFAEWIAHYNSARVHSALRGQTPLQRWESDATPIREIPTEQLRWMLLADAERTINKDGVHFDGIRYVAAALNGLVGERVQIRYAPHDQRQIEVFRGDDWLCTAYPQGQLSAEEREAVLGRRRADAAELARRQRRASRRARAKLAPITEPGSPTETTVVTGEQVREERCHGERDDRALRRLARTDLLGLHRDFDYWNRPAPAAGSSQEAAAVVPDLDRPAEPGKGEER